MGNLEELYNEAGIKKTSNGSRTKPRVTKVLIYLVLLGFISYWAFSTSVFGSSVSQPYYFIVITAILLFVIVKKATSFWEIIKQNRKFIKPE